MKFADRTDAAMQLIPLLADYANEDCIVLAVPGGGVPLGAVIAAHYGFPLEPLLTKKIGYPGNPELAIGAVSLTNHILDDRFSLSNAYVKNEITKIRRHLQERFRKFMGGHSPASLQGKTVIIVDDGIATGNTIMAAIKMVRDHAPAKIVVAVPVAPARTAEKINALTDALICLYTPEDFLGVGQFYEDFSHISDEEVISLLEPFR